MAAKLIIQVDELKGGWVGREGLRKKQKMQRARIEIQALSSVMI